uniref:Uncharacterized protein LOC111121219 n=1 Tax=Crassostrea virginica TaxID=6565 RepID=A0A8B8CQK3_CRAVI|nr:uncharacterized protein LOC111121219 [Crassostrea virginica]XP_022318207.1 uncharacterized protein LOC111121295 [Crassostrea virginica]
MMSAESQTSIGADANSEESLHLDEENDDEQWQSDENAEDSDPDSDDVSEYEESITFHNACREFYRNRKDATESFKSSMEREKERETAVHQRKKTTSIDDAMQRLRREMASLMDQDLTLMEQLLTLNEKIEDIKVKRLYGSSRESFHSSCDLNSGSDWSLPDSNVYCRHSKGYLGKATVHRSSAESVDDTGPNQVYRQTVSDEKDF